MALSFDSTDGGILSVDSHRVVPAPFLTKTYQLVDDAVTDDIVSWGEDGSTFVVWRPPEFARDLLPNYFKHNNFSSFVRQLNTYGFRKVVPDRWEFANDFFRKGERHLLCEIHRRKSQTGGPLLHYAGGSSLSPTTSGDEHVAAAAVATVGWSASPLQSPPRICGSGSLLGPAMPSQVMSLSDENERLRRDNCILLSELSRLQKLYDDAVLFLQQNMRLRADDFQALRTSSPAAYSLQQHHPQQQMFLNTSRRHLAAPAWSPAVTATPVGSSSDLSYRGCNSNSRILVGGASPVAAAVGAKSKLEGAAAQASTIDFVDGKLKEMTSSSNKVATRNLKTGSQDENEEPQRTSSSSGTRLFGVVLHGKKRSSGEECSSPSNKSAKTELELELMPHPAAAEAPWLKFRASRDAGVCR